MCWSTGGWFDQTRVWSNQPPVYQQLLVNNNGSAVRILEYVTAAGSRTVVQHLREWRFLKNFNLTKKKVHSSSKPRACFIKDLVVLSYHQQREYSASRPNDLKLSHFLCPRSLDPRTDLNGWLFNLFDLFNFFCTFYFPSIPGKSNKIAKYLAKMNPLFQNNNFEKLIE